MKTHHGLGLFMLVSLGMFGNYSEAGANDVMRSITCVSTVYEPFVIQQNGQIRGIDIDVVKAVGNKIKVNFEFALKPWKRIGNRMKKGQEDCVIAYFKTPDREPYMHYTRVPLHITKYTLFINRKKAFTFSSLKDLYGLSIAVNRGFKTTPAFTLAVAEKRIKQVNVQADKQSFGLLQKQRIDSVLTNYHVGSYIVKREGFDQVIPIDPPLSSTPAYVVFAKKDSFKALIPVFDAALFSVLQDGTYQKIFSKYISF